MIPIRNLYHHFRTIGEYGNFQTHQTENVLAVCSRLSHPGFNYVICLEESPTPALIQTIKHFFKQQDTSAFVWFQKGNTDPTRTALEAEAFSFTAPIVALTHDCQNIPTLSNPPELSIRKAEAHEAFDQWQAVIANTWDRTPEMTHEFFNKTLVNSLQEASPMDCYVAYWEDTPVGSCCLDNRETVGGLYWGAVLPAYRKRGIGTAMINKRLHILKERGAIQCVVQCLESSLGICKANGFQAIDHMAAFLFDSQKP